MCDKNVTLEYLSLLFNLFISCLYTKLLLVFFFPSANDAVTKVFVPEPFSTVGCSSGILSFLPNRRVDKLDRCPPALVETHYPDLLENVSENTSLRNDFGS